MYKKLTISNKYNQEIYFSIYSTVFCIVLPLIFYTSPFTKYSIWAILIATPFLGIPFGIMMGKTWKLFKIAHIKSFNTTQQ